MDTAPRPLRAPQIQFRKPDARDGAAIWELVRSCKPLDENSVYCNLIQCAHFRDTCIVAERDGQIIGWISGYLLPDDAETLFVWQVAVSPAARGEGLGILMLEALLRREDCADVRRLQTTITADNGASWALFGKLARRTGGTLGSQPHFTRQLHFRDRHDCEYMVTITMPEALRRAA